MAASSTSEKSRRSNFASDQEDLAAPPMKVSDEEMALNQIPLHARDCCAHLLIELKRCQRKEYFLPWKCEHQKHVYEACLLQDSKRREKIKAIEVSRANNLETSLGGGD